MADIYFKCRCGKNLAVDETGAGRMVNCPDCGYRCMIPSPALQWACPQCGASLRAPDEMCGKTVQCLTCRSEVRAPDSPDSKTGDQAPENLSAHLNKLFKECPQCHERVPARTRQCPHCGHMFSRRALRSFMTGVLCVAILAGVVIGLRQAGLWPFTAVKPLPPPAPAPQAPRSAIPAGPIPVPPLPLSNGMASAPAVTAEPSNTVSREQWLARFEASRQVIAGQVDRAYPRCLTNQDVSLRQLDGLVIHGVYAGVAAAKVTVLAAGKPAVIACRNIDAYDRLKADEEFRLTWIDAQAAARSRQSLIREGMSLSGLLPTPGEEALDQAMSLGNPQAQYQAGQQCYKQKDYAYAVLYFQAAAAQNHAAAQYALGIIFCRGIGVGANKKKGVRWLTLAAAQGHVKAERFIHQHKITQETRQKLLQQEQTRKERAAREHAAALRAYTSKPQTAPSPARPAGSLKGPTPVDTKMWFRDRINGRRYYLRHGKRIYED